jgi:hypothetical protein
VLVLEEDAAVVLAAHLVELALGDDAVDEEAHLLVFLHLLEELSLLLVSGVGLGLGLG